MKKYQELENKIAELQKEVDRLKKQEKGDQLPAHFNREYVLKILDNPESDEISKLVSESFNWYYTPQGSTYWYNIYLNKDIQDAIPQLQKWVIQSYREQYGD